MRITVDTNILISATFWIGSPSKIIKCVEDGKLELVLSDGILAEYQRILAHRKFQQKLKEPKKTVNEAVSKIITISKVITAKSKLDVVKEDPKDNKILECAVEGKVDYVVSGDHHLLDLKEYRGIKIVSAAEILRIIGVG